MGHDTFPLVRKRSETGKGMPGRQGYAGQGCYIYARYLVRFYIHVLYLTDHEVDVFIEIKHGVFSLLGGGGFYI